MLLKFEKMVLEEIKDVLCTVSDNQDTKVTIDVKLLNALYDIAVQLTIEEPKICPQTFKPVSTMWQEPHYPLDASRAID